VEGRSVQAAARCPEPVGDVDVVDAGAGRGNGELFADAVVEVAIAEEDSTSLEGEAVAVVPVVKHPGQQVAEGDGRIPSRAGFDRRVGAVVKKVVRENSGRSGELS